MGVGGLICLLLSFVSSNTKPQACGKLWALMEKRGFPTRNDFIHEFFAMEKFREKMGAGGLICLLLSFVSSDNKAKEFAKLSALMEKRGFPTRNDFIHEFFPMEKFREKMGAGGLICSVLSFVSPNTKPQVCGKLSALMGNGDFPTRNDWERVPPP